MQNEDYALPSKPLDNSQQAIGKKTEDATDPHHAQHNGIDIPRYAKFLRNAVIKKNKLKKADLKLPLHCSRGEITISDNRSKSTYYIESAMLKDEEARRLKKEAEVRMKGRLEDQSLHLMDSKVYFIKTASGKYKWWEKVYNKLVPFAVAKTRNVSPPT
ncbi:hypothetical protein AAHA92_33796 [Salvia divinorum]|uniref:Uncharacterized protein n=1 Tax=Salvia divinorum TaxID=28513 RepID=A0ABD1FGU4_SALDI